MSDSSDKNDGACRPAAEPIPKPDLRRPYEPPRVMKKRSIERATLFTAMSPAMTGITFMG